MMKQGKIWVSMIFVWVVMCSIEIGVARERNNEKRELDHYTELKRVCALEIDNLCPQDERKPLGYVDCLRKIHQTKRSLGLECRAAIEKIVRAEKQDTQDSGLAAPPAPEVKPGN